MKLLVVSIAIFLSTILSLHSQEIIHIDFDDCQGVDSVLGLTPERIGDPACVCGPSGSGLEFDGDQSLIYRDLGDSFNQTFGISFYVRLPTQMASNEPVQLMTIGGTECSFDSILVIRYLPEEHIIESRMSTNQSFRFDTEVELDQTECWHHIIFNRFETNVQLIVDGQVSSLEPVPDDFRFKDDAFLQIGGGPCIDFQQANLVGVLDEFIVSNTPINRFAYQLFPDRFVQSDTTIFADETVDLSTGNVCTDDYSIMPSVNETFDDNKISFSVTNSESVKYTLNVNYEDCSTSNSVVINVLNDGDLDCERLFVPTGFTPNSDNLNDIFLISNVFIVDELLEFTIYNRWGSKIFTSTNKNEGWNGTFNNHMQEPGNYAYNIRYRCGNEEYGKSGVVALIR